MIACLSQTELIELTSFKNSQRYSGIVRQKSVEKSVEKILILISANPNITQRELAEETGLSRRGVEKNIAKLKAKGILKRIGPAKGGHWAIIKAKHE